MEWGRLLVLVVAVFWGSRQTVEAIQLGEARRSVEARYGAPPIADNSKQTAAYQTGQWWVWLQYDDSRLKTVIYQKYDTLTERDIQALLAQHGGIKSWADWTQPDSNQRYWRRKDGATAFWNSARPRELALRRGAAPRQSIMASTPRTSLPRAVQPQGAENQQPPKTNVRLLQTPEATRRRSEAKPGNATGLQNFFEGVAGLMLFAGIVAIILLKGQRGKRAVQGGRQPTVRTSKAQPDEPWSPPGWTVEDERALPSRKDRLEDLSWKEFELLTGELFRRKGYHVEIDLGFGPDGGFDLKLHRGDESVVVQCKHWRNYKVGVKEIRELYGVMMSERIAKGLFVTSSTFTPEARKFAGDKVIHLIDRSGVERLISKVQGSGENILDIHSWVAKFASASTLSLPNCPRCGIPMVLRSARTGSRFWGCSRFPRCRGKRETRIELLEYAFSSRSC